jgi:hypothetical protein
MRFAYLCAPALLLALAPVARADVEDLIPLYNPHGIIYLLNDSKVKTELKLTKDQDKAVQAALKKFDKVLDGDNDTIFKMKGTQKEKFAQVRALGTRRGQELLQALGKVLQPNQVTRLKQLNLQRMAMSLFDHPEIREALNLNDKDVDALKKTAQKLRDNVIIEFQAGRLTKQEGQKRHMALGNTIPDGVRAQLTAKQRQILNEMLGEPFSW